MGASGGSKAQGLAKSKYGHHVRFRRPNYLGTMPHLYEDENSSEIHGQHHQRQSHINRPSSRIRGIFSLTIRTFLDYFLTKTDPSWKILRMEEDIAAADNSEIDARNAIIKIFSARDSVSNKVLLMKNTSPPDGMAIVKIS